MDRQNDLRRSASKNTFSWLIGIYLTLFTVRYALLLITSTQPTVVIDEMLYYSIAKSIASGNGLLYHAQSADYSYFLYPLILSPVYRLFQGAPYYRMLQAVNCLMMNSTVFPAFALAKEISGDDKKSLFLSVCTALLPDFMLGQLITSESLLYPLYFTLFLLIYRVLKYKGKKSLILCGLLGGIMYAVKPGAIAPACLILILEAVHSVRAKSWPRLRTVALSALIMVSVCGINYGIAVGVFGCKASLLSVYSEKLGEGVGYSVGSIFKSAAGYLFFFLLGGGLPVLLGILAHNRQIRDEDRGMTGFISLCVIVVSLLTVLTVNRTEYAATINTRYIAMYLPPLVMLCFARKSGDASPRRSDLCYAGLLCGFVAVFALLFGCNAADASGYYGCALVDLFHVLSKTGSGGVILRVAAAVFAAGLALLLFLKKRKVLRVVSVCACVLLFLSNGIAAYSDASSLYDKPTADAAREIVDLIGNRSYSLLTTDTGLSYVYPIEANTRYSPDYLYLQDLIQMTDPKRGTFVCYTPFNLRGIIPDRSISYPDILVLDPSAYGCVGFSDTCKILYDKNGLMAVEIPKEGRWADSMIHGVYRCELHEGTKAVLCVWNEELLSAPMTVRFHVVAEQEATLSMNNTNELLTVGIQPGAAVYELTFSHPEDSYNFSIDRGEIKIRGYELVN